MNGKSRAFQLFATGLSVVSVSETVDRARSTVWVYLAEYITRKKPSEIHMWIDEASYRSIASAIGENTRDRLKPVFEALDGRVSYDQIKVVAAHLSAMNDH